MVGYTQERGLSVEDTNAFFQAYTDSVMKHVDNKTPWYERIGDQYHRMAAGGDSAMSSIMRSIGDVDNDYGWEAAAKAQRDRISFQSQFNDLYNADLTAARKANGQNGFSAWFGTAKDSVLRGDVSAITNPIVDNAVPVAATIGANLVGAGLVPVTGGASLATTGALTATAFGAMGAGEYRQDIAESYDEIYKNNPNRLLELPEIQERIAQGMSLEQAYKDARGDFSDNLGGIAAATAVGMAESLLPVAKIGRGATRGVLSTGLKEVVGEVGQELAQQGVNNLGKGYVDGKTSWNDNFGETAAQALIAGGAFAIPSMLDARHNDNRDQKGSNAQTIDNLANNTQSEPQPTQPKSPVNGNVLEKILADYQVDQARRDELYSELKSDIEDGRLQQRLNESDREYADLARATGQLQSESAVENEPVFANSKAQAIEPEQETVFGEERLEQYRQASQDIVSAYQRGDITEGEVNARYAEIIQRYPEHQQFAQELYRRQQEDQEQQVLYSRSPMKSVKANIKRGRERMAQAILDKADVKRGMYHGEFGWVDFVWGDDGTTKPLNERGEPRGRGIAHIFEARERKDKIDYQSTAKMLVNNIVETIAKGSIATQTPTRLVLDYKGQNEPNGHRVILTKQKGSNAWILSGYEKFPVGGNSQLHDKTIPTQTLPTRSRQDLGATGTDNVQQSTQQRNDQIQQDQQTLSRLLGDEQAGYQVDYETAKNRVVVQARSEFSRARDKVQRESNIHCVGATRTALRQLQVAEAKAVVLATNQAIRFEEERKHQRESQYREEMYKWNAMFQGRIADSLRSLSTAQQAAAAASQIKPYEGWTHAVGQLSHIGRHLGTMNTAEFGLLNSHRVPAFANNLWG